jgi:1,6-anhydro-N-acetylmuramate kinase
MDFGTDAVKDLSPADGAATLTAFTAASIAKAREHFPEPAATWIVCGGGRHNIFLMDQFRARVNAPVIAAEAAGWNGDALEAEAFAYLAMRSRKGLPLSLPTTTGVPEPITGGKFSPQTISAFLTGRRPLQRPSRGLLIMLDTYSFTVSTTSLSRLSKKWLAPSILS